MMVRRTFRAGLLPGRLSAGQQNKTVAYLEARTALRGGSLWAAFVASDKHARADRAHYLHGTVDEAEPLEARIRELARELDTGPNIAAFVLGFASGMRDGLDYGRANLVRERAEANARRKARENPPPPFDPIKAQAEIDCAERWARTAGSAARQNVSWIGGRKARP